MKKMETSKIWSVRTESELLESFKNTAEEKNEKPNKLINSFITDYVIKNSKVVDFDPIDLEDNKEKLGYEKSFFTVEDANLIYNGSNLLDQDIIKKMGIEDDEITKQKQIQRLLNTGVKYSFTKLGINIYITFYFTESRNDNNTPCLDIYNSIFYYNEKTKEFAEITKQDFILI